MWLRGMKAQTEVAGGVKGAKRKADLEQEDLN